MSLPSPTRRTFLKTLGAASVAAPFIARSLRAATPSGVLRHASFGSAGMAWADIQAITSNPFVKLVAVAEVDLNRIKPLKEAFPDVKVYQDWRQLLEKEGRNIDSVNVSTPDHMHAPIAMSAMQLGKHVYCQKPLAHDIYETRMLTNYAREKKLVTQMGIQIHSYKVYRQAVAVVQSGAIGKVKEVHTWSNKKWGDLGQPPQKTDPVPQGLDWDLWLGGCAPRPYVTGYYHPGNWRKRLDFGTGTFGDMGCHIFDPVFEALALTSPLSLRSEGPAPDAWNWSINANIRYVFPGTKYTEGKTVAVTWYDGDARPPADIRALIESPATIDAAKEKASKRKGEPDNQGSIIIGTAGVLHIPHVAAPKLYPVAKFKDYVLPTAEQGHHWSLWAEACMKGGTPGASFDYSGPLTEAVLLGSVAVRFPQKTLAWDAAKLQFENEQSANQYVRRSYRKGWEVAGL
ncbi:Gfo/Idh/MocA family protein [Horticoccus sp. 23ND18S-11]|uniref:Gfo/Idh/MocA family protein n=1 Tax=Horticoccus sp. 23ND18S-11 TaxID=3391832 RepID=UPI0039C8F848